MRKLKALSRKKVKGGSPPEQLPHPSVDATRTASQSTTANPATLPIRPHPTTISSGTQSQAQPVASTSTTPPTDVLGQVIRAPTPTANDASRTTQTIGEVALRRDGGASGSTASKKDYWSLAVEYIRKEDSSTSDLIKAVWKAAGNTNSEDLATHLGDALKQSRETLEARRWKLTIGSKEIVIREQYERLAKGLLLFKDALNVAAGLDPLHAGIPVAGFCVLIEMTVADSEQYAAMINGVDEIVALVPRYQEIERLYRSRAETKLKVEFEKRLVNLYKNIIRYLVSAAVYYRRKFVGRFLRSIPKLDDLSELLAAIRADDSQCKDIGQVFNSSDALERHQQLLEKLDELKTQPVGHENTETYPVHWNVVGSTNSMFTGRDDTLKDLTATIQTALSNPTPQRPARIVITGMGGLGKSELCLQLAYKVRSMFWGVFWVDVSTEALAAADFLHIADLMQIQARTWNEACRGLSTVQKPWLLVLDNADDPNTDYQCYLPTGAWGTTIITSRNPECRQHSTCQHLPLDTLSEKSAQALILTAANVPIEKQEGLEDDATKVARLLVSHPLAMIQAGAYISRGHCSIAKYPEVYEEQRQRLLRFRPNQARSRYGDVYTTFEASADILQSSEDEAAQDALQLLSILATLSSSRLPLSLFGEAWRGSQRILADSTDREAADSMALRKLTPWHVSKLPQLLQVTTSEGDSSRLLEAVHLLQAFSLVTIETDGGGRNVSSHPLVHAWARDRQSGAEQHHGWLISSCLLVASGANHRFWMKQERRLQPHLQALVSWTLPTIFAQEPPEMIVTILLKCVDRLYCTDDHQLSLALVQQVCAHLGLDATIVDGRWRLLYLLMARALLWCGHPTEAVTISEQILELVGETWTENISDGLETTYLLALAYDQLGHTQKAVETMEDLVRLKKQVLEDTDLGLLETQRELASMYGKLGQTDAAWLLMEQVVENQEGMIDEDDPNQLTSEHVLARCYADRGLLNEAYDRMQHIVNVRKRILPKEDARRLDAEQDLAIDAWDLGFHDQAYDLVKHVVDVRTKVLNENDTDRLFSEQKLAVYSWELGSRDNAYDLMNHVFNVRQRILDETDSDRLTSERVLATWSWELGFRDNAYLLMSDAVSMGQRTQHEADPDRLKLELILALYSWELGYRERACALMQHVADMRRLTLAADDKELTDAITLLTWMEARIEESTQAP